MRRQTASHLQVAVLFSLAIGSLCADPGLVRVSAAEEPKPAASNVKVDRPDGPAHGAAPAGREIDLQRRVRARIVALTLWCAILVVGLALLAIVMAWGRSVRTLARRKPAPSTAPDPLWYLKTKPPAPHAPVGSSPSDPMRHPDDGEPDSPISGQTPS
jgi:hypothetical protein